MKKIPYQTLTIEFMSSYAGVVPPFSVIRPFTHFHLALSGDSGESCAVKCSCTRQCRFTKHGEGYLQLVNLKGKFHWFFIHKHIFFPLQFTQSINKRPITKNLNVLFYCHFNNMIHSVYFFSFMILKLESTLNVLLFIVPSSFAIKTQWKHFYDWIIPHEWIKNKR